MKYFITTIIFLISMTSAAHALVINEIMSNPVGDDSGHEWIELYNNGESSIDISNLTLSVKGGAFVPVTPVSGGTLLEVRAYAIIGGTVSGATKFALDFPSYTGPLLKSSMSLVNTGVTSLEIKQNGISVDVITSYTAAKEGSTYSLVNGTFVSGSPTPGEENKTVSVAPSEEVVTMPTSGTQSTLPQASPPATDIVLYLPAEKIVVAGAPTLFSVTSMNHAGKAIDNMNYTWAFGDGGQGMSSSTTYRYYYPGRYALIVEGSNGLIAGTGRMLVKVVSPDIVISKIGTGKYSSFIDITNPNTYDLDISFWRLSLDGALFPFPKNTVLLPGVTRFSGLSMGFASTTISSSTLIKLHFSNMDEVLRIVQGGDETIVSSPINVVTLNKKFLQNILPVQTKIHTPLAKVLTSVAPTSSLHRTTTSISTKKDVRLATYIKSFFGK